MTFPEGWQKRAPISVPAAKVSGTHAHFPLLLTAANLPPEIFSGATAAQNGGGDLRFSADPAGAIQLPLEVVTFVTGVEPIAHLWVLASVTEASDSTFYIWWRTKSISAQPAPDDAFGRNAVWRDFEAVLHLTNGDLVDSTGNGHDAVLHNTFGAPFSTAHPMGGTWFNFMPEHLAHMTLSASEGILDGSDYYISFWQYCPTFRYAPSFDHLGYEHPDEAGITLHSVWLDFSGDGGSIYHYTDIQPSDWDKDPPVFYQTHVWDSDTDQLTVMSDDQLVYTSPANESWGPLKTYFPVYIGRYIWIDNPDYHLDGSVTEYRLARKAFSIARRLTDYANQSDPATFAIAGTVEDVGSLPLAVEAALATEFLGSLRGGMALSAEHLSARSQPQPFAAEWTEARSMTAGAPVEGTLTFAVSRDFAVELAAGLVKPLLLETELLSRPERIAPLTVDQVAAQIAVMAIPAESAADLMVGKVQAIEWSLNITRVPVLPVAGAANVAHAGDVPQENTALAMAAALIAAEQLSQVDTDALLPTEWIGEALFEVHGPLPAEHLAGRARSAELPAEWTGEAVTEILRPLPVDHLAAVAPVRPFPAEGLVTVVTSQALPAELMALLSVEVDLEIDVAAQALMDGFVPALWTAPVVFDRAVLTEELQSVLGEDAVPAEWSSLLVVDRAAPVAWDGSAVFVEGAAHLFQADKRGTVFAIHGRARLFPVRRKTQLQ